MNLSSVPLDVIGDQRVVNQETVVLLNKIGEREENVMSSTAEELKVFREVE